MRPRHKSEARLPHPYGEPCINPRNGYRDLTMESSVQVRDGLVCVGDNKPVLRLEMDAEGLEWLIEKLPEGDLFTDTLEYAKRIAKHLVWEREAR